MTASPRKARLGLHLTRPRRTGRALLVVTLVAMGAKISALGCDGSSAHIFAGEQYDPTSQCLERVSSIDVVAGPDPGSCPPVCILSVPEDGGQIAYVSTMCPPYPVFRYESDASKDPLCTLALAAFKRNSVCVDGGVVLPPGDGSASGDGAVDAQGE